jgi:hypothetical protein
MAAGTAPSYKEHSGGEIAKTLIRDVLQTGRSVRFSVLPARKRIGRSRPDTVVEMTITVPGPCHEPCYSARSMASLNWHRTLTVVLPSGLLYVTPRPAARLTDT